MASVTATVYASTSQQAPVQQKTTVTMSGSAARIGGHLDPRQVERGLAARLLAH